MGWYRPERQYQGEARGGGALLSGECLQRAPWTSEGQGGIDWYLGTLHNGGHVDGHL